MVIRDKQDPASIVENSNHFLIMPLPVDRPQV